MAIRIIFILIFFTSKSYSNTECNNFAFNQFEGFKNKNNIEKINIQINKKKLSLKEHQDIMLQSIVKEKIDKKTPLNI